LCADCEHKWEGETIETPSRAMPERAGGIAAPRGTPTRLKRDGRL
jgi:hypothetical protein